MFTDACTDLTILWALNPVKCTQDTSSVPLLHSVMATVGASLSVATWGWYHILFWGLWFNWHHRFIACGYQGVQNCISLLRRNNNCILVLCRPYVCHPWPMTASSPYVIPRVSLANSYCQVCRFCRFCRFTSVISCLTTVLSRLVLKVKNPSCSIKNVLLAY